MNSTTKTYGKLCSIFYDATKKYAPEKEIDFYASFMDKNQRTLEAMSGSGRLQIPLIQKGYTVDGVDNSKIMLDRCKHRLDQLNLTANLYEQSLENLNLPHQYQTVTIAVGSFQLITDKSAALKALTNCNKIMINQGNLLIDIFTPDVAENRAERIVSIDANNKIKLTTRYIFNLENQLADALCSYELITNGIVVETEQELLQITWYSDDQFKNLLNQAGFEVIKIHQEHFRSSGISRIVHAKKNSELS